MGSNMQQKKIEKFKKLSDYFIDIKISAITTKDQYFYYYDKSVSVHFISI